MFCGIYLEESEAKTGPRRPAAPDAAQGSHNVSANQLRRSSGPSFPGAEEAAAPVPGGAFPGRIPPNSPGSVAIRTGGRPS
jgi:hypothetical protein